MAGFRRNNLRRRPRASVTPFGALETTLHMYQVRLKQQPPDRRLCPWRYTQGVETRRNKGQSPRLWCWIGTPVPSAEGPMHRKHLPGPWGPPLIIPCRFEAAATSPYVPWAMHTEGRKLKKIRAGFLVFGAGSTPCAPAEGTKHQPHLPEP